jgi:hypothetical protein
MLGVVKVLDPVANALPPVETSYQSIGSFVVTDALSVTVPVPHLEPLTTTGVSVLPLNTVAVTPVLLADTQPVVVFLASA